MQTYCSGVWTMNTRFFLKLVTVLPTLTVPLASISYVSRENIDLDTCLTSSNFLGDLRGADWLNLKIGSGAKKFFGCWLFLTPRGSKLPIWLGVWGAPPPQEKGKRENHSQGSEKWHFFKVPQNPNGDRYQLENWTGCTLGWKKFLVFHKVGHTCTVGRHGATSL